jgi:hypothetical protein
MDNYHQNGAEETEIIPQEQLYDLTGSADNVVQGFTNTTETIKAELDKISTAIDTWERLAPKLYFMKKRLLVIHEILSGKRDIESILTSPTEDKPEKKKRGPQKGKKAFIRRKSEILTDSVIEKIRDFIAQDEDYHKSKEIYAYLLNNNIIQPFSGNTPDRVFAITLSRVDQDLVKYNNHYSIMAWGLPDFGTPEHARRKALKNSVKGKDGTRISSYGRKEHEMIDVAVGV